MLKSTTIFTIVYTKEAETADQYIEKTVHAMGRKHRVTVATSDGLEQVIIRYVRLSIDRCTATYV